MEAALARFMPGLSGVALPRGEKLKTLVCLASDNTLEIANSSIIHSDSRKESGAEKMIPAKQGKARARSSPAAGEACRRVGVLAYRRLRSKTAFRRGYNDHEVSTKLMTLCKRRHADTPIRFPPAAHFERNDITIICETVH